MPSQQTSSPEVETLLTGLAMGESPRWHENRLWFSDWGAQEILAVDLDGNSEVAVRTSFGLPFCIDWLPDGRLLIVSGRESLLLRRQPDGSLVTHADLHGLSDKGWNEIVVDGRGNAYVNGGPGIIALVTPDSPARQVADGIAFPNGMAVTPDNATLIIRSPTEGSSRPSTSLRTAAWRTGACGPTSAAASPTASASTPTTPSGTRTFPTNAACAFAKVVRCCRQSNSTAAVSPACSAAWTRERCF